MPYNAMAVIPARIASERLPGKPLQLLGGKPIIQRVYEAVKESGLFQEILILTDSPIIIDTAKKFGGRALLTSPDCRSGTDRIIEVRSKLDNNIIVNVQGDEPFVDKASLEALLRVFDNESVDIASLMHPVRSKHDLESPNSVKVVIDNLHFALYFSRALIPYQRDNDQSNELQYYKHIGVYAFRRKILDLMEVMKPGKLEQIEKLEQLRWLEHGYKIKMVVTEYDGFGIDTPEELEKAEKRYR